MTIVQCLFHQPIQRYIYDDSEVGITVLSVHATDIDEDGNQPITFEIENDFSSPFDINSTSGSIYVSKGPRFAIQLSFHGHSN